MIPRIMLLALAVLFGCVTMEGTDQRGNPFEVKAVGEGTATVTRADCPEGTPLDQMKDCPTMTIKLDSKGVSGNMTGLGHAVLGALAAWSPGGARLPEINITVPSVPTAPEDDEPPDEPTE